MKGLLYKEWCLQKRIISLFVLLAFIFSVMGVLVFLSMRCGNLRDWPSEDPESVTLFLVIFIYVPYVLLLFASDVCCASVCSDYATGWMKLSYTLPTKAEIAVGSRYLFGCIILTASFVYGVVNGLVIYAMAGKSFGIDVIKNMLLILVIAVVVFAVYMSLSYVFKKSKTVSAFGVIFAVFMYFGFGALIIYGEKKYGDDAIKWIGDMFMRVSDVVSVVFPLIIAILLGLSFVVSVKFFQRREKTC